MVRSFTDNSGNDMALIGDLFHVCMRMEFRRRFNDYRQTSLYQTGMVEMAKIECQLEFQNNIILNQVTAQDIYMYIF